MSDDFPQRDSVSDQPGVVGLEPSASPPPDASAEVCGNGVGGAEGSADQSGVGPSASAASAPVVSIGDRLQALVEVVLCSGFPTQLGLGIVLMAAGMRPFDQGGRLSAPYVVTVSLVDTALLLVLVWGFLRLHGERPLEVVAGRRPWIGEVLLALPLLVLVAVAVVAALVSVRAWAPWLHNVGRNPFETLLGDRTTAITMAIVAIIAGGIREEVQRAFVLHRFDRYLGGGWLGLVLFSVAFGGGHAIQGWDVAIATGVMGAIWGAVYLVRRSAVAPMVSHALFNVAEVFRYTLYGL